MLVSSQRIALLGLALGPALVMFWMSLHGASREMIQNAAPFAVVSSVLAAVSVWIYGTFPQEGHLFESRQMNRPARLLRRSAHRSLPSDLPDRNTMVSVLNRALAPVVPGPVDALVTKEPERPETVLKEAFGQILQSWKTPDIKRLETPQVTELYLLHQLLMAEPADAGRMAELFLKPEQVLLIHEQVNSLRIQRRVFDRQLGLFRATHGLWKKQLDRPRPALDLCEALQALGVADVDLWHHVVADHTPARPDHRQAALWIALQRQCSQATVATFLSRLILDGHVEAAARGVRAEGDQSFVAGVRKVLDQWNRGYYRDDSLCLTPAEMVCGLDGDMRKALDGIGAAMGGDPWPMPKDMMRPFPGRPVEPRPAWSLSSGRLAMQPKIGDYVEYLRLKSV